MNELIDFADELQKIYDSEINVEISWLWDGGIDVRLGDKMNGYQAEENVRSVAEIIPWLQEAIRPLLSAIGICSLARRRTQGTRCATPFPTAPHRSQSDLSALRSAPAAPEFDELLAFVCAHCGNSVQVERPKIQ